MLPAEINLHAKASIQKIAASVVQICYHLLIMLQFVQLWAGICLEHPQIPRKKKGFCDSDMSPLALVESMATLTNWSCKCSAAAVLVPLGPALVQRKAQVDQLASLLQFKPVKTLGWWQKKTHFILNGIEGVSAWTVSCRMLAFWDETGKLVGATNCRLVRGSTQLDSCHKPVFQMLVLKFWKSHSFSRVWMLTICGVYNP